MTAAELGHSASWRDLPQPTMANLRVVCMSIIALTSVVVLVVIVQDGHMPSGVVPNVVIEHRHVHVTANESGARRGGDWQYNWDKRSWKSKSDSVMVPTRTLILVRHGQYDFKTGLLNARGEAQADLTGKRLKALGLRYDIISHSTMVRAVQTAGIIHRYFPNVTMVPDDILREGGPVPPNPTISYWSLPKEAYHVDGPRMEGAFRKYFHRASNQQKSQSYEILVGHGNIFRFFALRSLQLPADAWMRMFIPHASITFINIDSNGIVSMTRFGDSGHFPPDKVTY